MADTSAPADILRAAKARISEQRHYVVATTTMAWDRNGRGCDPLSPDAWRWTPRGAIYVESGIRPLVFKEISRDHRLYQILNSAARAMPHFRPGSMSLGDVIHECNCIHQVDENLSHAQALQAFDHAIRLAEEGEATQ